MCVCVCVRVSECVRACVRACVVVCLCACLNPDRLAGQPLVMVAYNSLAQARTETVRLPVPSGPAQAVYDSAVRQGSCLLCLCGLTCCHQGREIPSELDGTTLVFDIALPALGYATYLLAPPTTQPPRPVEVAKVCWLVFGC